MGMPLIYNLHVYQLVLDMLWNTCNRWTFYILCTWPVPSPYSYHTSLSFLLGEKIKNGTYITVGPYWKDKWQHFCCSSEPSHWQLIFVRSNRKGLLDPLMVHTTLHLCRAFIKRACNKRVSSSWRSDGDSLLDSQRYWIINTANLGDDLKTRARLNQLIKCWESLQQTFWLFLEVFLSRRRSSMGCKVQFILQKFR